MPTTTFEWITCILLTGVLCLMFYGAAQIGKGIGNIFGRGYVSYKQSQGFKGIDNA